MSKRFEVAIVDRTPWGQTQWIPAWVQGFLEKYLANEYLVIESVKEIVEPPKVVEPPDLPGDIAQREIDNAANVHLFEVEIINMDPEHYHATPEHLEHCLTSYHSALAPGLKLGEIRESVPHMPHAVVPAPPMPLCLDVVSDDVCDLCDDPYHDGGAYDDEVGDDYPPYDLDPPISNLCEKVESASHTFYLAGFEINVLATRLNEFEQGVKDVLAQIRSIGDTADKPYKETSETHEFNDENSIQRETIVRREWPMCVEELCVRHTVTEKIVNCVDVDRTGNVVGAVGSIIYL